MAQECDRPTDVRTDILLANAAIKNGTAQGSVIIPILFLLMINDVAAGLRGVQTSLFADDSFIYKSGRNLDAIVKCIQSNLDKICLLYTSDAADE